MGTMWLMMVSYQISWYLVPKTIKIWPNAPPQVLHEYWMVLRNHVSAKDELGMATERLRVRLPDEPKPKVLHIIETHEVSKGFEMLC